MDHYNIPQLPGTHAGLHSVAAATIILTGALVALDALGNAVPAASTVTGHCIGIADLGVDNSAGAAGDLKVSVSRGAYVFEQDVTNPVTKAHIGATVFAITPDTIAYTGTCRAGRLLGFDGTRPIVDVTAARRGPAATINNADGVIAALTISAAYSQAEVQALRAACEVVGDDLRALVAALKTTGAIS